MPPLGEFVKQGVIGVLLFTIVLLVRDVVVNLHDQLDGISRDVEFLTRYIDSTCSQLAEPLVRHR